MKPLSRINFLGAVSLLVVLLFGAALPARADVAGAMKELQTAMDLETKTEPKTNSRVSESDERRGNMGPMLIAQLRTAMTRPGQFEEILNQIPAYFRSEAVSVAVGHLRNELRAEQEAQDAVLEAQIQEVLARAAEKVRAATKTSDLDEALRDLARIPETEAGSQSSRRQTQVERAAVCRLLAGLPRSAKYGRTPVRDSKPGEHYQQH